MIEFARISTHNPSTGGRYNIHVEGVDGRLHLTVIGLHAQANLSLDLDPQQARELCLLIGMFLKPEGANAAQCADRENPLR